MSHDGSGERMLRTGFDGGGDVEQFLVRVTAQGDDLFDFRATLSERAGLVERNGLQTRRPFQKAGPFDEHTLIRRRGPRGDYADRRGDDQRGDDQRTRAGDHEQHQALIKPAGPTPSRDGVATTS